MDRVEIKLIVSEAARRLGEEHLRLEDHISDLRNRLDRVERKQDQLILRELRASFAAIQDAIATSNPETRRIRMEFAEENLLKNTELDPGLKAGGIENSVHMARAHHALFLVACLRPDELLAARHLRRAFEANPRIARLQLFPDVYTTHFVPHCRDIEDGREEAFRALDDKNYQRLARGRRWEAAGAFGLVALSAGHTIVTRRWSVHSARAVDVFQRAVIQDGKLASATTLRRWDEASLRQNYETKIDARCSELADALLSDAHAVNTHGADMDAQIRKLPSGAADPFSDE
jgi:hypothetical protein